MNGSVTDAAHRYGHLAIRTEQDPSPDHDLTADSSFAQKETRKTCRKRLGFLLAGHPLFAKPNTGKI